MGLDMYFMKKVKTETSYKFNSVGDLRKANAVHGWVVRNIQNNVDECQLVLFPQEKRKELLLLCNQVMDKNKKALKELSPMSGFFFGNTNQQEYYFNYIKETIKILNQIQNDNDIYYQASW